MFSVGYFRRYQSGPSTVTQDVTQLKTQMGELQTFTGNIWTETQNNTQLINDTNVVLGNTVTTVNTLYQTVADRATELSLVNDNGYDVYRIKENGIYACSPRSGNLYPGYMHGYISDVGGLGIISVSTLIPYHGSVIGRTVFVDAGVLSGVLINHGPLPVQMVWNRPERMRYVVNGSNPQTYVEYPVSQGIAVPVDPGTVVQFAILNNGNVRFVKSEFSSWPGITTVPAGP